MKKAVFCLSFDLELLWGRHDLDYLPFIPRAKNVHKVVEKLLSILEENEVPATWAFVGKLIENSPEIKKNKNLWYSPDIIERIKQSKLQELGCHTYSHQVFSQISSTDAEKELENCIRICKKNGIILDSFVFPRNKVAHLNLLKNFNFTNYRGQDPRDKHSKYVRKILQTLELFSFIPTVPATPRKVKGLIEIPGSFYFVSGRGTRKYIPAGRRFKVVKKGIEKAISANKMYHMWTHPIDFSEDKDKLLDDFDKIIKYVSSKRDEGAIEILTMRDIAKKHK